MPTSPTPTAPVFDLQKRFALTSLGVIVAIALGLGWLLSTMLTQRMLQREGEVSMDFIQNLLLTDQSGPFLQHPDDPLLRRRFLESMAHLSSMTEPVRANAYNPEGRVVWSTDEQLIGQRDAVNTERDQALQGQLVVHSGQLDPKDLQKTEHAGLVTPNSYYVESYIPIFVPGERRVLGVVELYKVPLQLSALIREALIQLWLACAASAVVLFVALNGVVGRANKVMREQQAQLTETQALAGAVELAGAVAHNLRNPLASIRVSAEMLGSTPANAPDQQEHCDDIMASVDRADRWITELVRVSNAPQLPLMAVDLRPLCEDCLTELHNDMARQGIHKLLPDDPGPQVWAHPAMLRQIVLSVLANAIEAMPQGGSLLLQWTQDPLHAELQVTDTGTGLDEAAKLAVFRPFFSTKTGGLGIGLALARRTLEQWGGSIDLQAAPEPPGSRVTLRLPLANPHPAT
ncbi:MAG: hypothetical protein RJA09_2678 [Pseudomonadota bacterium]